MIKKIWNDPVWSKVISVGILGLISLGYIKFVSVTEKISFKESLQQLFELKIPLVYVLVAIVLFLILKRLFRKKKTSNTNSYTNKQDQLRTFNKIIDPPTGIQFKWEVWFDGNTPFISKLTAFCTKHQPPLRFVNDSCPIPDCENSRQRIDRQVVKNLIESDLIDRWEKIK
jgi:hypothetical protein